MKVNYTYVETVLNGIENKTRLHDLENNIGYQIIRKHADITGNNFGLVDIKNAIDGISDKAYGLRYLQSNTQRIIDLYRSFKLHEKVWIEDVKEQLSKFFDKEDYEITIYPVIGYDIGIGIDETVCVNFNSEICLNDYKELVSIIIHEAAHIYYDKLHGFDFETTDLELPQDMINYLTAVIQYEGVGVFSAYEYRVKHNLSNTGSRIQEDYLFTSESNKGKEIICEYKRLISDILSGEISNINDFESRVFGKAKLPHRLGYNIFTEIYKSSGIAGVRNAIKMSNEEFYDNFMTHLSVTL